MTYTLLEAFIKRFNNKPKQIENDKLPAGAPIYFYCKYCGHQSDILPETYTERPKKVCDSCQALCDEVCLKQTKF